MINAVLTLARSIRRDIRRWNNARSRAKRVVYTWDRWQHQRAVQLSRRRVWQP